MFFGLVLHEAIVVNGGCRWIYDKVDWSVSNCDMLSVEIVEYKYFDCLLAQHCLATFNQIG